MDIGEVNSYKEKLGDRIKSLRESKGLSGRSFSLLAGVEHHQLINIEKGRVDVRFITLVKISKVLEMSVSELVSKL